MSYDSGNKQNDGPFYSDDISRKVVGKLYDSAEDMVDSDSESFDSSHRKEAPINNRFYEESRAERADSEDSIVVGFKDETEADEEGDQEYVKPSRARQRMGEAYDSDREERDKYRRQFLNSYTDVRRKGLEAPVGSETRKRPKVNNENKYDEAVRQELPIRKAGSTAKKTPRDYQIQNTPEKRMSRRNAPSDYSEKKTRQSPQREKASYGYSNSSANFSNIMDLFQLPIVKIAAGVFAVMFITIIILLAKVSGANKEIKKYEEANAVVQEDSENVSALQVENDGLKEQVRSLKDENYALTFKVEELEAEIAKTQANEAPAANSTDNSTTPVSSGGANSYTVQSGDNLSKISQKFYGSITGVDKIKKANNMTNDDIKVGQVLVIPE